VIAAATGSEADSSTPSGGSSGRPSPPGPDPARSCSWFSRPAA